MDQWIQDLVQEDHNNNIRREHIEDGLGSEEENLRTAVT